MFTAQLGDIGKSLKLKRKYGNLDEFSSNISENFSTFVGKYLKKVDLNQESNSIILS